MKGRLRKQDSLAKCRALVKTAVLRCSQAVEVKAGVGLTEVCNLTCRGVAAFHQSLQLRLLGRRQFRYARRGNA